MQAGLQPKRPPPPDRPNVAAEPLLELRALTKTFGQVTALAGLDATIARGEFVTVVGPSGCGKSTLFNIVAGLEEPDAGGILRFEGRSCHAADLLGQVSFMPQRDLLLPWRNVIDNAILALEVEGVPRAGGAPKARHAAGVRPDRLRGPVSASVLRRHAPARGADAHLPVRARPDAAGRAVRRARRADAGDDAALAARRLAALPPHHPVHHP